MAGSSGNDYEKHRARVREKFIKNGFKGFLDYEILEMLLFYCIPVKDTKKTAKDLIKEYKTLANVFEAPRKDLMKIEGIGPNSALFLSMIPEIVKTYETSKWTREECLSDTVAIGQRAVSLFTESRDEEFGLICLDANRCVHWCGKILEGTKNETPAYPRKAVEVALKYGASKVVLTHNHPGGTLAPSIADKQATDALIRAFNSIGIDVLDHIIVSGTRYFSMKEMGFKF